MENKTEFRYLQMELNKLTNWKKKAEKRIKDLERSIEKMEAEKRKEFLKSSIMWENTKDSS